ncbi:MAG: ATP-dependent Clp protease proteolytic subunit [Lachnospiraceae bacterium]|nr:ATP-dependent Clp protease proteolytic subunit [Lachnospiraceae bacterium]
MNTIMNAEQNEGTVALSLLEGTRIIYINGPIDDNMAYHFNTALLRLEHDDGEADVVVYINSPGGSVTAGLSMIDTMNFVSCDVQTICVGMAASMGAMLLMSGEKGKRKILPHSLVLIHQPLQNLGNAFRQASDLEIAANEMMRTKKTLYKIIEESTGQDYEKIEKDCDRDYTLTAEEALEYGIVDEIIRSHKNGRK